MESMSTLQAGRWRCATLVLLLVAFAASGLLLSAVPCLNVSKQHRVVFNAHFEPGASRLHPGHSNSSGRTCAAAPLPKEAFFVIHTYDFTEAVGGITVLHYLVDRLNRYSSHGLGRCTLLLYAS